MGSVGCRRLQPDYGVGRLERLWDGSWNDVGMGNGMDLYDHLLGTCRFRYHLSHPMACGNVKNSKTCRVRPRCVEETISSGRDR